MDARRHPLSRLNAWIESTVEKFIAFFVRTPVQPAFIASKLESAMENGTFLQKAGQRLAPNVYDINLSVKDHQRLSPSQFTLIKDWQESLIAYALTAAPRCRASACAPWPGAYRGQTRRCKKLEFSGRRWRGYYVHPGPQP